MGKNVPAFTEDGVAAAAAWRDAAAAAGGSRKQVIGEVLARCSSLSHRQHSMTMIVAYKNRD
eukprot:1254917-Pleurochrysis_carterae.AAC.2